MTRATRTKRAGDPNRPNAAAPPEPRKKYPRRSKPKSDVPTTQAARVEAITHLMVKGQWTSRQSTFELAKKWDCSLTAVSRAADHASVRIRTAEGELAQKVTEAAGELDRIKELAIGEKQYTAAVRAVELKLKLFGALAAARKPPTTEDQPRGLPPELAQLSPPPSVEEVEHFAAQSSHECPFETCRVHQKAARPAEEIH